jgi:DNA-binding FadR family transcriptional regulator
VRPRRDWNFLDPDILAWQVEAGPDSRFLEEALELRRLIEPPVVRLAAERATEEQIVALEQAHKDMKAAGESLEDFMEPDIRFHAVLFEACDNELLEQMSGILTAVLRSLFSYSARPPGAFARSARRHGVIAAAIRARDPDAAETALLRLISDTRAHVGWARKRGWHQ